LKGLPDLAVRTVLDFQYQLEDSGEGLLFETGAGKALFMGGIGEIEVGIGSLVARVESVRVLVEAALGREYEKVVSYTLHISARAERTG